MSTAGPEVQALFYGAELGQARLACDELFTRTAKMLAKRMKGGTPVSDQLVEGLLFWAAWLNADLAARVPELVDMFLV